MGKTSYDRIFSNLKTFACALAFAGALAVPASSVLANETQGSEPSPKVSAQADAKVQEGAREQVADKRAEIISEAVTAIEETRKALAALDEGKEKEAIAALERATGKLEILLAREPELALAPTDSEAVTYDLWATPEAVLQARKKAMKHLEAGRVQEARRVMQGLASEIVIRTTNVPLVTYPAAIKIAASLIDDDRVDEAKRVLQTALNTLVVKEEIVPLPVMAAEAMLEEAEKLAEKSERSDEENKQLAELLKVSREKIEFAQALGYGDKKDFKVMYKELDLIEEKTAGGKSGEGFFEKIKKSLTLMQEDSQPETKSDDKL